MKSNMETFVGDNQRFREIFRLWWQSVAGSVHILEGWHHVVVGWFSDVLENENNKLSAQLSQDKMLLIRVLHYLLSEENWETWPWKET